MCNEHPSASLSLRRRSVTGQQIYSPELGDWTSGEWTINMTTELDNGQKEPGGRGTGKVIAKMKMIATK